MEISSEEKENSRFKCFLRNSHKTEIQKSSINDILFDNEKNRNKIMKEKRRFEKNDSKDRNILIVCFCFFILFYFKHKYLSIC